MKHILAVEIMPNVPVTIFKKSAILDVNTVSYGSTTVETKQLNVLVFNSICRPTHTQRT